MLKKEQWKQEREKHIVEELEKFGYSYLLNNPKLFKYWKKRHLIFSKFEKGVQLDEGKHSLVFVYICFENNLLYKIIVGNYRSTIFFWIESKILTFTRNYGWGLA